MSEHNSQSLHISKTRSKTRRISQILGNKNEGVVFNYQTVDHQETKGPSTIKLEDILSNKLIAGFLSMLIIIYTILVLIRISFETETDVYATELDILELVFLSFFIVEVLLRVLVYRLLYFKYIWNIFDVIIIIVCLIVIISSLVNSSITQNQAFKLGKVLRIFRLFLMFRKINIIKKYKDKISKRKSAVVNLSSPSEKVIEILTSVLEMEWISYHSSIKTDIEWCIYMIKEQKIYQTNVRADKEEFRDFVNWAVNGQLEEIEDETPAKTDTFIKVVAVENYGSEIESLLADSHKWDFDVFKFDKAAEGKSLEIITGHLFSLYNLYLTQSFDSVRFLNFIRGIQAGYHKENLYHNATHAADVVQSYYYFLSSCQAIDICQLMDSDIAVCLISSAIHDYDHPGLNNIYLINTSNSLAITYNDKSVLENFHVASAFKLLNEEKNNFMERIQREEKKKIRFKIISLVLATDFARHFNDLGKFQLRFSSGGVKDDDDKLLVMEMMMHTSDVGNPSRPWKLCYEWATNVMNEFFAQGDKERDMGLTISNLCDRFTVSVPKSQIGFTELFIEPTFHVLEMLLPNVNENLKYIIENKEYWKEMLENNKSN